MPVMSLPGSDICPVRAYRRMIAVVKGGPKDPAFGVRTNKVIKPVVYSNFQKFLKKWVADAGWDDRKFSTHSLRRGGASLAFRADVPSDLIKVHGDWASDCYLRYLSVPLEQRIQVASRVRNLVQLQNE